MTPTPDEEWHLDTALLGRRVLVYSRLDSTNTALARLAAEGAEEGLAVLADEQTAGRGQHGRTWLSRPRAGVLLSVLVRPPPAASRASLLTVWAGLAVCTLVEELTGITPALKWPNDVLLAGKKVCGVLVEQTHQAGRAAVVAGIGLNVTIGTEELLAAGLPDATSLAAQLPCPPDTHAVARTLLRHLDHHYGPLAGGDTGPLTRLWHRHLGLLGEEVLAETTAGPVVRGRLSELTFERVVVEWPGGRTPLPPEGVRHLRRAE